jgi:hypothetical protein
MVWGERACASGLEEDGRWLAEVVELPGALAYGASADEAMVKAEALALRALAEQLKPSVFWPLSIAWAGNRNPRAAPSEP